MCLHAFKLFLKKNCKHILHNKKHFLLGWFSMVRDNVEVISLELLLHWKTKILNLYWSLVQNIQKHLSQQEWTYRVFLAGSIEPDDEFTLKLCEGGWHKSHTDRVLFPWIHKHFLHTAQCFLMPQHTFYLVKKKINKNNDSPNMAFIPLKENRPT